jgi:hypothetical protein
MRNFLEIVYFVTAGPGLLIAAIVGLRSLILSKQAMAMTERRARLTATAEQIKYFVEHVVPKFDLLEERISDPQVTFFGKCEITLDENGIGLTVTEDIANLDDVIPFLTDTFLPAPNSLSAWSAYFVHGVADEEVAYRTLAADFLHAAEQCLPLVILLQKQTAHDDLTTLYHAWRTRFETDALGEMGAEVVARLNQLRHGSIHIKTQ